jgi:hypothetical protein
MRCTGRGRGTGRGARGWRRSSVDLHRQHFICPHRRNGHRSFLCCSRGLFPCLFCGSAVALLQARSCLCLRSDGASGTSTSSGDNGATRESIHGPQIYSLRRFCSNSAIAKEDSFLPSHSSTVHRVHVIHHISPQLATASESSRPAINTEQVDGKDQKGSSVIEELHHG